MIYRNLKTVTVKDLNAGDVIVLNSGPFTITQDLEDLGDGTVRIIGTNGDGVEGWSMIWQADLETLIRP